MARRKIRPQHVTRQKEAKRQLIHRYYLSLVYNAFKGVLADNPLGEDTWFQNYAIDMKLDSDEESKDSWDLVLFRLHGNSMVDLIFVEVKTSVDSLKVRDDCYNKIQKTIELLDTNKNHFKVGESEYEVACAEFVIACQSDIQDKLKNKFVDIDIYCPIILWRIDDSASMQDNDHYAKISIPYVFERGIKTYPLCPTTVRRSPGTFPLNKEIFTGEPDPLKMEINQSVENLKKHNNIELLKFLGSPNVVSGAYVPGRSKMTDSAVNIVVLITSGPLSGQGPKVNKSKDEWVSAINDFYDEYGLLNDHAEKSYGDHLVDIMLDAGILEESDLSSDFYHVKNYRGKASHILDRILEPIIEAETRLKTGKL